MSDESLPGPALERQRKATIDALCEHFADDLISVEEFERRVDGAHGAESPAELEALLQDLPAQHLPASRGGPDAARPSRHPVQAPEQVREHEVVVAILGGTTRKGRWRPARKSYAIALMGGAELDFREAVMPPGITEVQVYAMWGGVDVIVPPGLRVESRGLAIMGGFDHAAEEPMDPRADTPTLRLTGFALMGGVDISVRRPGESAREARRRRRQEQKARKLIDDGF